MSVVSEFTIFYVHYKRLRLKKVNFAAQQTKIWEEEIKSY